MTTKKPSELPIKRGKRKPISLKRDDLKSSDWYTAAVARFAISSARHAKDRHSDRDGSDGESR
jgi:hypothetical protein